MKEKLSKNVFEKLVDSIENHRQLDQSIAADVAHAMKEWAIVSNLAVGQPRYPSLPGRWLCVPLFREVCLFRDILALFSSANSTEIFNYFSRKAEFLNDGTHARHCLPHHTYVAG